MSASPSSQLDQAIRRGTRVILAAQVVSQLISLIVLGILFRFVSQMSFGLLGMIAPWVGLPRMLALAGVQVALIQPDKLTQEQKSSLFWMNLIIGLLSGLFVAGIGFLLAELYDVPQLAHLGLALSGTSMVMAAAAAHQSLLERRLAMRRLTVVRIVAQTAGAISAVACAVAKFELWSLIVQQYAELFVLLIGVWCCEPWRPNWVPRLAGIRGLVKFGSYYSLSNLLLYVAQNVDKVLLGWWLGRSESGQAFVGMYCQAFNLMMRPVYLVTSPLAGIFLPALSRLQRQPAEFAQLIARIFRMTSLVLFPAGVGLALVSADLMRVMGGEKWSAAGWILAALAPVICVQGMLNLCGSIYSAAGRTGTMFAASCVFALVVTQGVVAGYFLGGLLLPDADAGFQRTAGVAWGYTLTVLFVVALPYLSFCGQAVGVRLSEMLRPLTGILVATLVMAAFVYVASRALPTDGPRLRLLILVLIGVAFYWVKARGELRWFSQQLSREA